MVLVSREDVLGINILICTPRLMQEVTWKRYEEVKTTQPLTLEYQNVKVKRVKDF